MRAALLGLVLIPLYSVHAEWVPLDPSHAKATGPAVTLIEDTPGATMLRVDVSGFDAAPLASGAKNYTTIDLRSESSTNEPGNPAVPYVPVVLAVPDQGEISVEVVESSAPVSLGGYFLPPARPSWKEGDDEPPYAENAARYQATTPYPAQSTFLEKPVVFRDFRIVRLQVYPVRTIPVKGEIQVTPSITVRVRYGAGPGENPRMAPHHRIPPSFGRLYRSMILNYQSVLDREYGGLESGRDVLLVITPDMFRDTLQSYVRWKHQSGIFTVLKTFTEIGVSGTDPAQIKNYISTAYTTWPDPPTHVLLVGDTEVFPVSLVVYDYTFANEDYFVELTGDDYFPEMFIGRFTHQTVYRLGVMMNKFLKYERTPYTANPAWFTKGIVCSNNNYESQVSTKRFTAELMRTDGGFTSVDTMMSSNPCVYDVPDVINAINQGRSYLNYRGEGWTDGWAANCLPFHTGDVSTINNGQMFTFVTSIGCGVAMFNADGGNSFGEEWVEMGTLAAPRGACAFIGPTSNTHTTYNNKIDRGIYIGMFQEGIETPGEALVRGKLYMYQVYGNEHWVEYHSRIYCVLGDPSIHIWRHLPRRTTVTVPSAISVGYNQVQVMVRDSATAAPVAGAQVCIAGDSVYALATTDGSGLALLDVTVPLPDTLSVVARGPAVIPFSGSLIASPSQMHIAPQGAATVTDTDGNLDGRVNPNEHVQLSFTLKNWGTQAAPAVSAMLASQDTALAAVQSGSPAAYGTIAPSGTATAAPFVVFVKPACPVGQTLSFTLHVTSGASSWDYVVRVPVTGCVLSASSYVINDQGSAQANARLDPGETAVVYVTIANTGSDGAPNVGGRLRSTDPRIVIQDSVAFFGTVDTASTSTSLADYFVVTVADTCPRNIAIPFTLALSTTGGRYPYTAQTALSLPIGAPTVTDPTGPDAFGYYVYTSDDSVYEQAPQYAWTEINGLGSVVPGNANGDFTITATLPFSFRYYGTNFTQLRISSDGWIAFGSGTETAWSNYPLPNNDGISAMVAPFWDDLFDNDPQEIGKVLYYYDAPNHRFIIEWLEVGHWSDATDRETFQVILLDPLYHPTNTGNGEILFMYRTVVEDGSMTLGFENPDQNGGITYVFNDAYDPTASSLKNEFAVRFTTEPPTIRTTSTTVGVAIHSGWNLISNPVLRPVPLTTMLSLYPHSSFDYAFGFDPGAGYTQHTMLETGRGYWGKFPSGETQSIAGGALQGDSVAVAPGWNIIGSISAFVDTAQVTAIPSGIRSSVFFGYSGGYFSSAFVAPGQAYWVKANAPGVLVMGAPGTARRHSVSGEPGKIDGLHSIAVTDNAGMRQTLFFGSDAVHSISPEMFAMPPLPPAGAFDCRFETPEGGSLIRTHGSGETPEFPFTVSGGASPLTISWVVGGTDAYELLAATPAGLVRLAAVEGTGRATVTQASLRTFLLRRVSTEEVPREYVLEQNYPNPFNPSTSVRFGVPVESHVTAEVFNALGQKVRMLLSEERKAGYHTLVWDGHGENGRELGTGTYFLRVEAQGASGRTFSATRKLLLIK